jgi:hypothetical protein
MEINTHESAPYVSVVVAARNDDHGGNMLGRIQAFLDSWVGLAKRFDLSSEILVVEWNPPETRPGLADALAWPTDVGPCRIRFIQVPREVHEQLPNSQTIPLHQMIAKNVGIRRARGRFVLSTNLDIIFSAELMRYFAERGLDNEAMYRIDRHDVAREVPSHRTLDELLEFCRRNTLRVFTREREITLSRDGLPELRKPDIVAPEAGIRLGRGWFEPELVNEKLFRWVQPEAELVIQRQEAARTLLIEIDTGPSAGCEPVLLEVADPCGRILGLVKVDGWCKAGIYIDSSVFSRLLFRTQSRGLPLALDARFLSLRVFGMEWQTDRGECERAVGKTADDGSIIEVLERGPARDSDGYSQAASRFAAQMRNPAYLHINACGDFTLLSRKAWFALRGYPEFPIWPMHIDSLLCYAAHHAGMREVVLREPMRIYHIEHSSGAGWTPEGEEERNARIEAKKVRQLQYAELVAWIDQMRRFNAPVIFTQENWGLGDLALQEETI